VVDEVAIGVKFRALAGEFNERQRRLWAASEARAAGGIAATARATGMAVDTIRKGIVELEAGESIGAGRVRRRGGGRKALIEIDPRVLVDLEWLVDRRSWTSSTSARRALLDAACGAGLAVQIAARRGAHVNGFDATPELPEIARERTPTAKFATGELESLPYPDHSFDAVAGFNSSQ
jgi:SAM-dependent methyltransferase